jgi:hypothetical protein
VAWVVETLVGGLLVWLTLAGIGLGIMAIWRRVRRAAAHEPAPAAA